MPITNAEERFVHELADMYDAEHQFLDAIRLMHEVASDQKLKTMLGEQIKQTQEQIQRLEQVFSQIDQEPERQECSGAKGLVEEASKMMEEAATPELRDAIIVGAAIKAEHYEMAGYADLIECAEMIEKRRAVKLLNENREEEVQTVQRLEKLSPRLNKAAA